MIGRLLACGLVAVPFVAAGCGSNGRSTGPAPAPPTTSAPGGQTTLTVFRAAHGLLQAHSVQVPRTTAVAEASVRALDLDGSVTIADGTARVALPKATGEQTAEIVYTLTQYRSVDRVEVGGRTGLTRADVPAFVPPILIESPADGAAVRRTFRVQARRASSRRRSWSSSSSTATWSCTGR
jgi:hypothetical protein